MFRKAARATRLAVLAVAFITLGCESPTEAPGAAPLQVESSNQLLGGLLGRTLGSTLDVVESSTSWFVEQVTTVLIDPVLGGEINLLGHTLTIPAGAVDAPTYFVMMVLPGNSVRVELFAIDAATGLDVGADGFDAPVGLTLSWANMNGVKDPSSLVIAYMPRWGGPEALDTEVDETAQTATADLRHFSRYALCRN